MKLKLCVLLLALCSASLAHAVCYRDGKAYPTGAVVGDHVCQADGTWKRN